jgi:hypothetical protein
MEKCQRVCERMSNLHKELNRESDDEQDSDKDWADRIIPSRGVTIPNLVVPPNESIQWIDHKDQSDWQQNESIKLSTTCS